MKHRQTDEDRGADGPASLARPSAVRAVQPDAGHATVSVRECYDTHPCDVMHHRGQLSDQQRDAAIMVWRAYRNAGLHRRVTMRLDAVGGGEAEADGWPEWRALIDRVPEVCRVVVISVCAAGQWPSSPAALARLQTGLRALAKGKQ